MPRQVEIKLKLPLALAMVDLLREQVAVLEMVSVTAAQTEPERMHKAMLEVRIFMALFRPNFPKTGSIIVVEKTCPPVLRALSFVRLHMRANTLPILPVTVLESAVVPDGLSARDQEALGCYVFLATLQQLLVEKFASPTAIRTLGMSPFGELSYRVQALFRRRGQTDRVGFSPAIASESRKAVNSCQVVVLDDPVNLMVYVTAVLRSVVALSQTEAERCMREVHELKSSIVWEGPRGKAEAYVRALQSWHLSAVLRDGKGD